MKPKDTSVNLANMHLSMQLVIETLDVVARKYGLQEIVLTSGQDGHHMHGSKHHQDDLTVPGEAVDARLRDILERFAADVRRLLTMTQPNIYDVVLEWTPQACPKCGEKLDPTVHLHIEHDPKDPIKASAFGGATGST